MSGKTPPPAPSAAYAKRAREIQAEERLGGGRYRPPALRAAPSTSPSNNQPPTEPTPVSRPIVAPVPVTPTEESVLPPTNFPAGFRRARAGTLPSNVQLAAQRYASTLPSNGPSADFGMDTISSNPTSPAVANPSSSIPSRPNLRHASTMAAPAPSNSGTGERVSRLRSGSLTLPTGGLSNAFGPSIFSSSWLSNPRGSTGNGFGALDELRSITSNDSMVDDFDHTLDYLGLDDHMSRPPPATMSELRTQAQAAIAGRLRASTVSMPYRNRMGSLQPPLGSSDEGLDDYEPTVDSSYTRQRVDSYDGSFYGGSSAAASAAFMAKGFKSQQHLVPARPRAISVGNLDDPNRAPHRRASEVPSIPSYPDPPVARPQVDTNKLSSPVSRTGPSTGVSPTVRFPTTVDTTTRGNVYLQAPGSGPGQQRSVSPKGESASPQLQTPSRSLWIGNLDSTMTAEALIHVFAPYGAIESLRLLPEKECGFVNFVDTNDAIRAKDDVLNRLAGNIGMQNGQAVRIGFGKAESAPPAPAKTNGAATTTPGLVTSANAQSGGIDPQLQSTPTRALWIGSIPSTTTPATILSVFSPYGPIESARVLTHKNCGFINFERLDDAVRARKALNGRDVLGSDVGAIRIGFARVPVKSGAENADEGMGVGVQGVGDLSVGATIHALRGVKGASTIPADQQVLGGNVENYRSNLVLSMIGSGAQWGNSVTDQQMIMRELSNGASDAEADIQALAEFRPPTMYYTTIPLVAERPHNRRWDATKLRELRKRLDSGVMTTEEINEVAADFLDGEIVDLASDWLGNTVVQKLFEKCSPGPRLAMLERLAPHLAMIGIHKNGTWAAQKVIECVSTPEELALIAQNLRPYAPPLLLDQFGNYVVQCCLRFGSPANDFIFDAMIDRLWEVAQGRFGARSMRACLESPHITISQQRRIATAVILNSIPLATNPNGALLLTWLLDNSGFPSRYSLLAPRFTPHLSHLCTHKLASLTVLRIVNQKVEPKASLAIVEALFESQNDHVLTDVLGDQVNGVAVVHKILTSPFLEPNEKPRYLEATKRVLVELKVIATQAYRRLIEEVGLPIPNFPPTYSTNLPSTTKKPVGNSFGMPGMPSGYSTSDPSLASMMASMQGMHINPPSPHVSSMQQSGLPQLQINPNFPPTGPAAPPDRRAPAGRAAPSPGTFSPSSDPFNPFSLRSPDLSPIPGPRAVNNGRRSGNGNSNPGTPNGGPAPALPPGLYNAQPNAPQSLAQAGQGMMQYASPQTPQMHPQYYQPYMYQHMMQGNPQNVGGFHT